MFPRASVLADHSPKFFIPNTHIFTNPDRGGVVSNKKPQAKAAAAAEPSSSAKAAVEEAVTHEGGAAPGKGDVDSHPVDDTLVVGHGRVVSDTRTRDCFVQAGVESITPTHVVLDRKVDKSVYDAHESLEEGLEGVGLEDGVTSIKWDYIVYVSRLPLIVRSASRSFADAPCHSPTTQALGCQLPPSLENKSTSKADGVAFLNRQVSQIARARKILIVGGGALGIQYATDIATLYGTPTVPADPVGEGHKPSEAVEGPKQVTLVHSRETFLPLFSPELGVKAAERMEELGVELVRGHRVQDLPSKAEEEAWMAQGDSRPLKTITLADGTQVEYDLLLRCTGQSPNSAPLRTLLPQSVSKQGFVQIRDTIQVQAGADAPEWAERIFVAGDVADAGVIKAGHTGWNQGELAAKNILARLKGEQMADYVRTPPMSA